MQVVPGILLISAGGIHHKILPGRKLRAFRENPLCRVLGIVGKRAARKGDGFRPPVAQLYAVVIFSVRRGLGADVLAERLGDVNIAFQAGHACCECLISRVIVGIAGGGVGGLREFSRAVRHARHGTVRFLRGIGEAVQNGAAPAGKHHVLLVSPEAERRVQFARFREALVSGAEDDKIPLCRDDRAFRERVFFRLRKRIRKAAAGKVNLGIVAVVKLNPVRIHAVCIRERGGVRGHEFIDGDAKILIALKGGLKRGRARFGVVISRRRFHFSPGAGSILCKRVAGGDRAQDKRVQRVARYIEKHQAVGSGQPERSDEAARALPAAPDHDVTARFNLGAAREHILYSRSKVIRKAKAAHIKGGAAGVLQLHPIRVVAVFIRHGTLVARHDLAQGKRALNGM